MTAPQPPGAGRGRRRAAAVRTDGGRSDTSTGVASSAAAVATRQLVALGLPGSGKTTFLAALWHVIGQGATGVAAPSLVLANLRGSREYLNQIADEWVNGREVARTPVGAARTTTLTLQDRRSATTFDASFPDVSGEAFMEAWAGRELQPEVHALLATAHGLLLFVHAADVTPPTRIDEWRTVFGDALGGAGDDATLTDVPDAMVDDPGAGGDGTPTRPSGGSGALVGAARDADDEVHAYDATKAPTDTILVDLLQAFGDLARERTPVPVALVVSAWDLVQRTARGASAPTPAAWVAAQLPLMTQFLEANARTFSTRIYGVSAQGGDVRDAADVARLRGMLDPEERIVVVGPAGTSGQPMSPHDLSAPVRWALLGEEGA